MPTQLTKINFTKRPSHHHVAIAGAWADPRLLEDKKNTTIADIDKISSAIRDKYTTRLSGQYEIYFEKARQASACALANYPVDLTEFPLIQLECTLTGKSPQECVSIIMDKHNRWLQKISGIELIRRTAKIAVVLAVDDNSLELAKNIAVDALNLL